MYFDKEFICFQLFKSLTQSCELSFNRLCENLKSNAMFLECVFDENYEKFQRGFQLAISHISTELDKFGKYIPLRTGRKFFQIFADIFGCQIFYMLDCVEILSVFPEDKSNIFVITLHGSQTQVTSGSDTHDSNLNPAITFLPPVSEKKSPSDMRLGQKPPSPKKSDELVHNDTRPLGTPEKNLSDDMMSGQINTATLEYAGLSPSVKNSDVMVDSRNALETLEQFLQICKPDYQPQNTNVVTTSSETSILNNANSENPGCSHWSNLTDSENSLPDQNDETPSDSKIISDTPDIKKYEIYQQQSLSRILEQQGIDFREAFRIHENIISFMKKLHDLHLPVLTNLYSQLKKLYDTQMKELVLPKSDNPSIFPINFKTAHKTLKRPRGRPRNPLNTVDNTSPTPPPKKNLIINLRKTMSRDDLLCHYR